MVYVIMTSLTYVSMQASQTPKKAPVKEVAALPATSDPVVLMINPNFNMKGTGLKVGRYCIHEDVVVVDDDRNIVHYYNIYQFELCMI